MNCPTCGQAICDKRKTRRLYPSTIEKLLTSRATELPMWDRRCACCKEIVPALNTKGWLDGSWYCTPCFDREYPKLWKLSDQEARDA